MVNQNVKPSVFGLELPELLLELEDELDEVLLVRLLESLDELLSSDS